MNKAVSIIVLLISFNSTYSQINEKDFFKGDSILISRLYNRDFIEFVCQPISKVLKNKDISKYEKIELSFTKNMNYVDGILLYYNDIFYLTIRVKKPIKHIINRPKEEGINKLLSQNVATMTIPLHLLILDEK